MKARTAFPLIFFLTLLLFISNGLRAQMTVNNGPTPQQLVQNMLVGDGVQVSNVTFTGDLAQVGSFNATMANLPYDTGVVMSTGNCADAVGPNDLTGESTSFLNYAGDPDLLSIAQQTNITDSINDAVILEFDIVPRGDSVSFNFIFGSDEYTEFVGDVYNDVFGFFLSGPGITGPGTYQNNAVNLAQIPGTTTPISISGVNPTTNSSYYVDNGNGSTPPFNNDPAFIQADGRTVSLTAEYPVNCGQTYHLALKLGDGQDPTRDSWVFLKGGSLSSSSLIVDEEFNFTQNDSTLWEGCGTATLGITRQGDTSVPDTVWVETSGTASEGADYGTLPDSLFFAPGQDSTTLSVSTLNDALPEGTEQGVVDLIYKDSTSCAEFDTVSVDFYIQDSPPITTNAHNDTLISSCSAPINLWASANGGIGDYDWSWDQGIPDGDSTGMVNPSSTTEYIATVSDTCGSVEKDTIMVNVKSRPQVDAQDTTICIGGTAVLSADATGGTPPYTYHWDQGLGTGSTHSVSPGSDTDYEVYVEDDDGCFSDTIVVSLTYHPPLQVSTSRNDSVCPGDTVQLIANASGGQGPPYDYTWSTGGKTPGETVAPTSDNTYGVTVADACETPVAQDSVYIGINPLPDVSMQGFNLSGCRPVNAEFVNTTPPSHVGGDCIWDFGDGTEGFSCDSITHTYTEAGCYDVTLTLRSPEGCVDSATQTSYACVHPYPDADFDWEPKDASVQDPQVRFTNMTSGGLTHEWDFGGLDSSKQEHPSYRFPNDEAGEYDVCLSSVSSYGCPDSICKEVTVDGRLIIYVPNAFTPDGDGLNDEFGPVIQGADPSQYQFMIFDRWGHKIFETSKIEEGWDGSVNGSRASRKTDVFVWKLLTENKYTGEDIERTGQVTVIQ